MNERTLAENFALLALNGQDSLHKTVAKTVSLRCMAAAALLELYLENSTQSGDSCESSSGGLSGGLSAALFEADTIAVIPSRSYQREALAALFKKPNKGAGCLSALARATRLSSKSLLAIERAFVEPLFESGALEEVPKLLACDLLFDSSGVDIREYRAEQAAYTAIADSLRAELLEEGPLTDEAIILLWLLRESGCLHDIFSHDELSILGGRMVALYQSSPLARSLYTLVLHRTLETTFKRFLHIKQAAFSTPVGVGLNFVFPVFERSQSVFVDTDAWFSDHAARLAALERRLREHGHNVSVLQTGAVPLIKIDNCLYRAVPTAQVISRVPIHGLRLRKCPLC